MLTFGCCFDIFALWITELLIEESMLLYGRELNTPLDIITQPNCDETDEPGIPYPESLIMLGPFGLEAMPKGRSITTRDVDLLLTLWMSW